MNERKRGEIALPEVERRGVRVGGGRRWAADRTGPARGQGTRDEIRETVCPRVGADPHGAGVIGGGAHVGYGHPAGESAAQLDAVRAAPRRDEGGVDDVGGGVRLGAQVGRVRGEQDVGG